MRGPFAAGVVAREAPLPIFFGKLRGQFLRRFDFHSRPGGLRMRRSVVVQVSALVDPDGGSLDIFLFSAGNLDGVTSRCLDQRLKTNLSRGFQLKEAFFSVLSIDV